MTIARTKGGSRKGKCFIPSLSHVMLLIMDKDILFNFFCISEGTVREGMQSTMSSGVPDSQQVAQ